MVRRRETERKVAVRVTEEAVEIAYWSKTKKAEPDKPKEIKPVQEDK